MLRLDGFKMTHGTRLFVTYGLDGCGWWGGFEGKFLNVLVQHWGLGRCIRIMRLGRVMAFGKDEIKHFGSDEVHVHILFWMPFWCQMNRQPSILTSVQNNDSLSFEKAEWRFINKNKPDIIIAPPKNILKLG